QSRFRPRWPAAPPPRSQTQGRSVLRRRPRCRSTFNPAITRSEQHRAAALTRRRPRPPRFIRRTCTSGRRARTRTLRWARRNALLPAGYGPASETSACANTTRNAILVCVQATTKATANAITEASSRFAEDLYALVVYLHKNCNTDLFAALGTLELTLTQIKLLHHLEDAEDALTLNDVAEAVLVSLPA